MIGLRSPTSHPVFGCPRAAYVGDGLEHGAQLLGYAHDVEEALAIIRRAGFKSALLASRDTRHGPLLGYWPESS